MKYLNKTLSSNETVVSNPKVSKWCLFNPYLLLILGILFSPITAGLSLLTVIFPIMAHFYRWTTEYGVTNKKVMFKTGWIRRKTDELYTKKIEGVDVVQGIQGRIFGYGDLVFSGTGSQTVVFKMVPNPLEVKKLVQETI
jgi:uncharacterized membrane protein YdbT with pleckstrin-like domain